MTEPAAPLGMLTRLGIAGYKSIQNAELELKPLNVLIGPNGAGKSNFIGLFRFLRKLAQKDLQLHVAEQGGADDILYFGRKVTDKIELRIDFKANAYSCTLVPTNNDRFVFAKEYGRFFAEKIGYSGGDKLTLLSKPGAEESGLPARQDSKSIAGHLLGYLQDCKTYHFHDTSPLTKVKQTGYIDHHGDPLQEDAGNLASFLAAIRDTSAYDDIVQTIQRVAPFFHDFILEPEKNNADRIVLRWKHRGTDRYFNAHALSDGTLRFICLATLLLQPDLPAVILLDEPELGLHPHALQLLAGIMRSVSTKTQIIASTQSVTLANQFGWEDLIVVDRIDNASTFRRLKEDEVKDWLDSYSVGDLWAKNLIGGTPE